MNEWFRDPRSEAAEAAGFRAEKAERRGDLPEASRLYREAAAGYAVVALNVSVDHPNTRTVFAIAAAACYLRAGADGEASRFARRMLAEPDALTEHGRQELRRMSAEADWRLAPRTPAFVGRHEGLTGNTKTSHGAELPVDLRGLRAAA